MCACVRVWLSALTPFFGLSVGVVVGGAAGRVAVVLFLGVAAGVAAAGVCLPCRSSSASFRSFLWSQVVGLGVCLWVCVCVFNERLGLVLAISQLTTR